MRRLSSNKEDQQFVSDLARLEILMRIAIHDFVPNENYKTTVMYWANQSTTAAAAMLFKRHKNDLKDYIERYETELKMLEIFGPALRQCANNERAVQTTQIRKTFMSKQNPETRMAENIIEGNWIRQTMTILPGFTKILGILGPLRIYENFSFHQKCTKTRYFSIFSVPVLKAGISDKQKDVPTNPYSCL
jgi:hypothetical protein